MTVGLLSFVTLPSGFKAQVNVQSWDINDYGEDFPFIDCMRTISNVWFATGTYSDPDPYAFINANGYPTQMVTGASNHWNGNTKFYITPRCTFTGNIDSSGVLHVTSAITGDPIFVGQTLKGGTIAVDTVITSGSGTTWQTNVNTVVASATLTAFDPWILDNTGTITIGASPITGGVTMTPTTISSTRIQYDCTGLASYSTVAVTMSIGSISVAPTSIRFFRKSQEALLATQITAPHYIAFYQKWGRARFMDIQRTNNVTLAQWSQRSLQTDCSWVGATLRTTFYGGLCTNSGNDYTAPTSVHGANTSWSNGDMLLCRITNAPTIKVVSGFTAANPAKVTCTGHGYTTGDFVTFPRMNVNPVWNPSSIENNLNNVASGNPGLSPQFQITVIDANNFTLDGIDSTSYGAYVSGGSVMKCVRFKCGSLPFKRITYSSFQNLYESDILSTLNQAVGGGEVNINSLVYNATADVLIWSVGADNAGNGLIGAPYEVILQVSNEVNGPAPWLCLPCLSDASYATSLATLVKTNLNSNLYCCFEFGNEVWNLSTFLYSYASVMGALLFPTAQANQQAMNAWFSYSTYNMNNAITTVFAGQLNRVRRIIGCRSGDLNPASAVVRLTGQYTGIAAQTNTVSDELCIDNYVGIDGTVYPSASSVYNYKAGVATSNSALIASAFSEIDAAFAQPYTKFVGGIDNGAGSAGNLLTVSSVSVGSIYVGMVVGGGGIYFGFSNPPVVSSFGTGTGGAGTYNLSGGAILIPAGNNLTSSLWANVGYINGLTVPFWKANANTYSIGLSFYEGNWGIQPSVNYQTPTTYSGGSTYNPLTSTDQLNLFVAYQASSNWATVLTTLLNDIKAQGGIYPSQYTLTSNVINGANMYGMVTPNIFAATNAAYAAYVAFNNN